MKKLLIALTFVLCAIMPILAQEDTEVNTHGKQVKNEKTRDKSVYLEFYGPSNLIDISYDARFKGNRHFGYRIGLSYKYGKTDILGFYDDKSHSFAFPIEVNCLVGKGSSRLELGLGTSLGFYYTHWHMMGEEDSASAFGYFFYGNIGYRLTTRKGFQFRIGLTPTFNFGGDHAVVHDPKIYPYLSFGYAF